MTYDPYLNVIRAFSRARVDYIIIGVSGINYYAKEPRQVILTSDYDFLLPPDAGNLVKVVRLLRRMDYELTTRSGPVSRPDMAKARKWIDYGRTILASNSYGVTIDLCFEVSGFDYDELDRKVRIFRVRRTPIRVADLAQLLRMKEVADRPKDRQFLEKHRLILKEMDEN